jgi:formylglycine-generating enzyme required for sulfatase activity
LEVNLNPIKIFFSLAALILIAGCGDDGTGPANRAPVIESVTADPQNVGLSESTVLQCAATDPDNDVLVYTWSAEDGTFPNGAAGTIVFWQAPGDTGTYPVTVRVSDGELTDNETIDISVIVISNRAPVIESITAEPAVAFPNSTTELTCVASDEDGDSLTYTWSADAGSFPQGSSGSIVQWQAPGEFGEYYIRVTVDDGRLSVRDSIAIMVDEPPLAPSNPDPPDGSTDQRYNLDLSWSCSDPDGDVVYFDIYLGQSPDPPLVSSHQTEAVYSPGNLEPISTYHWKIIAEDQHGAVTEGPLWSFSVSRETFFALGNTGAEVEMVWIPPGSFMMGQPDAPGAGDDEWPRHLVTFDYGFWLGKYEITQAQWGAVMGVWSFGFPGNPLHPAERVSWNDIHDFIDAVNAPQTGDPWRLPSESEWEYSCLAGRDTIRFWWGDDIYYQLLDLYAWYNANSGGQTHYIGTSFGSEPNPWGLWDMHGNVWEWCEDWYHETYEGAPDDGSPWVDPPDSMRVIRGGAFYTQARQCMSTLRSMWYPNQRINSMGFRLARDFNS